MANFFENNILLRQIDNKGDFMVLKFAFVNDAAEREYKKLPEDIQDEFGKDLRKLQFGQTPTSPIQHLDSIGAGVVELKINGRPAYRCVYVTKYLDTVVVLHSFVKTTNGI
ncbi:type II toxin-antitoxin system RelE/ParE family toxin, partial [Vibrio parahaemolyticus]|nr:type II toxin-antitoxin system RelE/ParE family toxin [Vibrio parahaemolyticus]